MVRSGESGKGDIIDAKEGLKSGEGQIHPEVKQVIKASFGLRKKKNITIARIVFLGSKGKSRLPWIKKGMGQFFPTSTSWYTEKMIIFEQ